MEQRMDSMETRGETNCFQDAVRYSRGNSDGGIFNGKFPSSYDIHADPPLPKEELLGATTMAQFAVDGYLFFEEMIPSDLNEAAFEEQQRLKDSGYHFWAKSSVIRSVFQQPSIQKIIQSLLGPRPIYDHSFLHVIPPKKLKAQDWHADSVIDTRPHGFDIQIFYFCHDTPLEMGPTLILPGSHLRRVNTSSIGRYKNIVGQKHLTCRAGTVAILHHGLWHCGQPNVTNNHRYMFKLRLRPSVEQRNLFNTEGADSPEIADLFSHSYQPWLGNEGRLEHILRAKFWRYLVGDDSIDVSFEKALTRMHL